MQVSNFDLEKTNVLFITVDCCRYDTFLKAKMPYIKSLGVLERAKTHGTYTLPAHLSFFMGYLPIAPDSRSPYYASDVRQLWRLVAGRPRDLDTVGIMLDGKNIFDGYRKLGFTIVGSGGVRWFENPTLTELFDKFLYYGPDTPDVFLPRKPHHFSLNHIPEILRELKGKQKVFLFINSAETHVPYDFGEGLYSHEIGEIILRAKLIWGCKRLNLKKTDITGAELQKLHAAQIVALESIDQKVKRLVESLNKPLLLVISGDHGECFGEGTNWGHGYPHPKVMEVPLLIAKVD